MKKAPCSQHWRVVLFLIIFFCWIDEFDVKKNLSVSIANGHTLETHTNFQLPPKFPYGSRWMNPKSFNDIELCGAFTDNLQMKLKSLSTQSSFIAVPSINWNVDWKFMKSAIIGMETFHQFTCAIECMFSDQLRASCTNTEPAGETNYFLGNFNCECVIGIIIAGSVCDAQ